MAHNSEIIITATLGPEDERWFHNYLNEFKNGKELSADWECVTRVGGTANLGTSVFVAAYNYLDYALFVEMLEGIEDDARIGIYEIDKESIQVLFKDQDDEFFTLYNWENWDEINVNR